MFGIHRAMSTVYHPQGNAPVEQFHRHLRKAMSLAARDNGLDVDEALQMAAFTHRTSPNTATGQTPAFLVFGQDPLFADERDWRGIPHESTEARLNALNQAREMVRESAANMMTPQQGAQKDLKFQEGQLIVGRASPNDLDHMGPDRKLAPL
eukprot:GHVP01056439.1.p1 GENE.GHVP01056439.1~~GHVP01056439.1.p1  ORF type:complete len:152 (-),score=19.88 GHVP01056439.1:402-857(-)